MRVITELLSCKPIANDAAALRQYDNEDDVKQHWLAIGTRHMPKPIPKTVDDYIALSPTEVQPLLKKIRKTISEAAPQAQEVISYGMPALKQRGILVYFAAFKKHIGLYPPVRGDAKLMRDMAPFAGDKGNLRFPLGKPIPYGLIRRIVKHRVLAQQSKASASQ